MNIANNVMSKSYILNGQTISPLTKIEILALITVLITVQLLSSGMAFLWKWKYS